MKTIDPEFRDDGTPVWPVPAALTSEEFADLVLLCADSGGVFVGDFVTQLVRDELARRKAEVPA